MSEYIPLIPVSTVNTSCCICFEELKIKEGCSTVVDCCNQRIHTDCLISWFIFKGKVSCPLCRDKCKCITVNDIIMHLNKIKKNSNIYPTALSFNYPKINSLINDLDLPFIITIVDTNTDTESETDTEILVIDNRVYAIILVLVLLLITREIFNNVL
jgi:hypothetical protein